MNLSSRNPSAEAAGMNICPESSPSFTSPSAPNPLKPPSAIGQRGDKKSMAFPAASMSFSFTFTSPPTLKAPFACNSSTKSPPESAPTKKPNPNPNPNPSPSLSDQLRPLSLTLLNTQPLPPPLTKPKPTWVNPSRPKPTVLSLDRHRRRPHHHNPDLGPLSLLSRSLSSSSDSDELLAKLAEAFPDPPSQESALLILNNLRPWQNCLHFFDWLKTQNFFPLEAIFYNVVMKSLRQGKQYELVEKLAHQMLDEKVELDNITYCTVITCLKKCRQFDRAIEWFERMYRAGVVPDEVTYSAVLDVYAKLGKREEVIALYERARAGGWKPDPVAFSVLAKMFGEAGDYDGIQYVLGEMKSLDVKPNVVVYNTLLEAMGKAGKPGIARGLFEEMVSAGLSPNEKTLTALIKIYGKARWSKDALELWERMKANRWPVDFILYNTLLSMCADVGLEEEAEQLFEEMKNRKGRGRPDNWSYTAMINIYGSGGKAERALELFDEMLESGVEPNVMCCTCLIQCLAKAGRMKDAARVFETSLERGVKPDDRLCGCLLSVIALCEQGDTGMVLACLEKANPRLVKFVEMLGKEETSFEQVREELRGILNQASVEVRRPFCNCLIDICRNQAFPVHRAHEILYLGNLYGLYPGLHTKSSDEWSLNLRSLSIGAANTAFEEWMKSLSNSIENEEALPENFSVHTGAGTHRFSQGLPVAFASHLKKLAVPFQRDEVNSGSFVATREVLTSWVRSRVGLAALVA